MCQEKNEKDSVDAAIRRFEDNVQKNKERQIKATRNNKKKTQWSSEQQ